jgi:hypothetical protein
MSSSLPANLRQAVAHDSIGVAVTEQAAAMDAHDLGVVRFGIVN